jgi:hypothetical protein
MPGGLAQLVAYGASDCYLESLPKKKLYTNFTFDRKMKKLKRKHSVKKLKKEDVISAQIFTEYIYLDTEERKKFAETIEIEIEIEIEEIEEEIEEIVIEI